MHGEGDGGEQDRWWGGGAAGGAGVRRGVWHPLSCLLKASFFLLSPLPPRAADRRYFQRPGCSAALRAYFTGSCWRSRVGLGGGGGAGVTEVETRVSAASDASPGTLTQGRGERPPGSALVPLL